MRVRLEQFFKQRRGLAWAILLLTIFALVFVIPKIYFSIDANAKKMFWGTLLLSFGIIMFVFFGQKPQKDVPLKEKAGPSSTPRSYQKLIDEVERCFQELKKCQRWAIGCLLMGWIVLWIGRWSEHPPYNHPIIAIPVFALAFLAATKSWEKENELDVSIANCTVDGIEIEKKRSGLKSSYFHDLASSYEGRGMWQFAFVRVSPSLLILASLFNAGPLSLLANYFSIPSWAINCGAGAVLGAAFLFFARMACQPYYWLLERRKTIAA
jgi:hypothetical protein